jgi:hypothetical protein
MLFVTSKLKSANKLRGSRTHDKHTAPTNQTNTYIVKLIK